MIQAPGTISCVATAISSYSKAMWHLLRAHQQESFLPFSSCQSLSCCLSHVAKRSTLELQSSLFTPSEPHGPLFTSPKLPESGPLPFPSEPRGTLLFYFRTTWTSIYLLASEPRGSPIYFRGAWSTPHLLWSRVVSSFLPGKVSPAA